MTQSAIFSTKPFLVTRRIVALLFNFQHLVVKEGNKNNFSNSKIFSVFKTVCIFKITFA